MLRFWAGSHEQRNGDSTAAISGGIVEGNVRWQITLWASSMSKDMEAAMGNGQEQFFFICDFRRQTHCISKR